MISGIVLAAGAGRRYGGPKAFEVTADGESWVARAVRSLIAAGCSPVIVTLPTEAELGLSDVLTVVVPSVKGQSGSLAAALAAVPSDAVAAVITLVDLPDVDAAVVRRVLDVAGPVEPSVLARATFDATPGHPVLIGSAHFEGLRVSLAGDRGARDYLAAHAPMLVECSDLATGVDVDER